MNVFSGNVLTFCKSLVVDKSLNLNAIISRNVRYSCITTGRKKVETLWPNTPHKWAGGKNYYGFTYYPRYPDQQDPAWERTPLFMVKRRCPYRGNPFWLKKILRDFRIEQKAREVAIVINSEHNNKLLWKIKHLVTITPITFPDGIPEEKDIDSCRLYPNGELRFNPNLKIDAEKLESTETFQKRIDKIDAGTILKYTRQQWLDGYQSIRDF